MLKEHEDALGRQMLDYYTTGQGNSIILEGDDGNFGVFPSNILFGEFTEWPTIEQQAMNYVRGRVLDIGCGPGRHSLYLQEKGHDVVGIDNSPLTIEIAKRKGLRDARICSITEISSKLGIFGTIILLGGNFSLFGTPKRAKWILRKLYRLTDKEGRIIAMTRDPYITEDPDHLAYHESNRKKGKWGGQSRIRIRYRKYRTPWKDFLMVSKSEMESIVSDPGWIVKTYIDGDVSSPGVYVVVLEKQI